MKTFYKIEEGKLQIGSGELIPESFIEYEVGKEPQELLDALAIDSEEQRIQAIKAKAGELINSKYPSYKQLNVLRIGGAELEAMTAYIDGIRAISNEAESNGTKVEDVQWL